MKRISTLSDCDGRRTAIVLSIGGEERTFEGMARCQEDPDLGSVLQISIEDGEGVYELMIVAARWDGDILDGADYGCDVCLVPHSTHVGRGA
jgi:hypothetical protein